MTTTRRQRRPRGLPLPPGTPRIEVLIIAAQSAAAVMLGVLGIAAIDALNAPGWVTTVTCMAVGGSTALAVWVTVVVGRGRVTHARRWRDDPAYRKQWGQGL